MKLRHFLKKKVRIANWQLPLLKWSSFGFGILFGSIFGMLLFPFLMHIFVASVVLGLAFTVIWIKALKKACAEEKAAESEILF